MGKLGRWSSDRIVWDRNIRPVMSGTTATVKYSMALKHFKTTARAAAENINMGGATSGIQIIQAVIPFKHGFSVVGGTAAGVRGLPSVVWTFAGATVTAPAGIATLGGTLTAVVFGRTR